MLPKIHGPGESPTEAEVSGCDPVVCAVTAVICVSLQIFQTEEIQIWRFRKVKRKNHDILLDCISDFQNCA